MNRTTGTNTRQLLLLLLLPCVALLAACSGDQSAPQSAADLSPAAQRGFKYKGPKCQFADQLQVLALFEPRYVGAAVSGLVHLDNDAAKGRTAAALADMYQEWKYTLDTYYAGRLRGGMSARTQQATLSFGQALYCMAGLDGSGLTLSTTPLDASNVVQVVYPSPGDQHVVTGNGHAGVMIPGGTLTTPVTISVSLLAGPYTFPAGPLNTKLDQYGPFFEFKVVPEQTFSQPVIAAQCIQTASGGAPPSSVDIAHNVGSGIQILPTSPVSFLNCGATARLAQPSAFELAQNGEYTRAMRRIGSAALDFIRPEPVYAFSISGGMGGKTTSFSPFGGVDTAVVVTAASGFPSQPQSAAAGSNVAVAPAVLVQTPTGHTPLGGASVTFLITSGGGSIGATTSNTAVTTATTTSDNTTGIASVPNWTMGAAQTNTITASASFTLPETISGFATAGAAANSAVVVSGNPVTFTGTSTDLIPYRATGYLYTSGNAGLAQGFEQPNYSTTAWQSGSAAFGNAIVGPGCPTLSQTVGTAWPTYPIVTDMLLRHSFTLPAWWNGTLTLGVAIDASFQAYVDGMDVTPHSAAGYDAQSGFVKNSGCAGQDNYLVPISVTGGSHTLAIRARDLRQSAYVDVRVAPTL